MQMQIAMSNLQACADNCGAGCVAFSYNPSTGECEQYTNATCNTTTPASKKDANRFTYKKDAPASPPPTAPPPPPALTNLETITAYIVVGVILLMAFAWTLRQAPSTKRVALPSR